MVWDRIHIGGNLEDLRSHFGARRSTSLASGRLSHATPCAVKPPALAIISPSADITGMIVRDRSTFVLGQTRFGAIVRRRGGSRGSLRGTQLRRGANGIVSDGSESSAVRLPRHEWRRARITLADLISAKRVAANTSRVPSLLFAALSEMIRSDRTNSARSGQPNGKDRRLTPRCYRMLTSDGARRSGVSVKEIGT